MISCRAVPGFLDVEARPFPIASVNSRSCVAVDEFAKHAGALRFVSIGQNLGEGRIFRRLTLRTKKEQCSYYVLMESVERRLGSSVMLKTFVEEAAALTSLVLFVGMIAIWAQVIPQM